MDTPSATPPSPQNNQPAISPGVEDMFEAPGQPGSSNQAPATQGDVQGIDCAAVNRQLAVASQYIQETETKMVGAGVVSQTEIDDLKQTIAQTTEAVRTLEINHANEFIELRDGLNKPYQILVRSQALKEYDTCDQLYQKMVKQFDDYFNKHVSFVEKTAADNHV